MRFGVAVLALVAPFGLAAEGPELEALPATVEVGAANQPAHVLLIVRNESAEPLADLTLRYFDSGAVTVTPAGPLTRARLPARAAGSWELDVSRTGEETSPASVQFHLTFTTKMAGAATPRIVTRTLPVTLRPRDPADKFLDVQVASSLETLESSRDGALNLLFTNKTGRTVNVVKIGCSAPEFLEIAPVTPIPLGVQPFGAARAEFRIVAKDRVVPGKHLLAFDIVVESREGRRTLVASREVTVGVLGESPITKVLGVGSFLLMPGWLAVVTFSLLFRAGLKRVKKEGETFLLKANEADFWLVSVALSILFAVVVRLFSGRWFFVQYGLNDVAIVWGVSIGVSVAVYLLAQYVWKWRNAARTPSKEDQPVDILRKLGRQGLALVLDRVTLGTGDPTPAFIVQAEGGKLDPVWVSPGMKLNLAAIENPEQRDKVSGEFNGSKRPGELADLLDKVPAEQLREALKFETLPFAQPSEVAKAARTPAGPDIIVTEV